MPIGDGGERFWYDKSEEFKLSLEKSFGIRDLDATKKTLSFLMNFRSGTIESGGKTRSCIVFYFQSVTGKRFKVSRVFEPYLLLRARDMDSLHSLIVSNYPDEYSSVEVIEKKDLQQDNHLSGIRSEFLKVSFDKVPDLVRFRAKIQEQKSMKIEMREYDVPYEHRVLIDMGYRVGKWYYVHPNGDFEPLSNEDSNSLGRPDMKILAYDIETSKAPLRFPDPQKDVVMMISYMVNGAGYLIINRSIVSKDIDDFEYTPKPEFPGKFKVYNEKDERSTLLKFIRHIQWIVPDVVVTFNGDFFDFPFIEERCRYHNIDFYAETGFYRRTSKNDTKFVSDLFTHIDCFRWVKRDSYLPMGSQGLKAVTRAKLKYDPLEIDPEDMTPFARTKPQKLSNYSVSDAVATYYLYMKYIHPFIFSLASIIPMPPNDINRAGTGTLCELLMMVSAFEGNIVFQNKHQPKLLKYHKNNLILGETYSGGRVEAISQGVFRSDLEYDFELDTKTYKKLIVNLGSLLDYYTKIEAKLDESEWEIVNYNEVYKEIYTHLTYLKNRPVIRCKPKIYHLDVAAMYPNIILTNRLQPTAIVTEKTCRSCVYNSVKTCQRRMQWKWRGNLSTGSRSDVRRIKADLEENSGDLGVYLDRNYSKNVEQIKSRLSDYKKRSTGKTHFIKEELRTSIVCQREDPFYVNTVRMFRDRRYEYKGLLKRALIARQDEIEANGFKNKLKIEELDKAVVLYDSLQLAHKVILNSFYGYVMRKGARWYNMEMAGIVTHTGANIIREARELIEKIGIGLELDTDGIWCCLPERFPDNYRIKYRNRKTGKVVVKRFNYPCALLNKDVYDNYTNHQYAELIGDGEYKIKSVNSIEFEVDGPYRAMILPSSTEKDKSIKKRYAVFNEDGSLAELKGFEIKRRGELKIVKELQGDLFKSFLKGNTLFESYQSAAAVCNKWLNLLKTKCENLEDFELIALIGERKTLSKSFKEYEGRKMTTVTAAWRLAQLLGKQVIEESSGSLTCNFIISKYPIDEKTTERAVPIDVFSVDESTRNRHLTNWLKMDSTNLNIRDIIDWDYYIGRVEAVIQKIVTIPAQIQKLKNPIPSVRNPDWLQEKLHIARHTKLTKFFTKKEPKVQPRAIEAPTRAKPDNSQVLADILQEYEGTKDKEKARKLLLELWKGEWPDAKTRRRHFRKYRKVLISEGLFEERLINKKALPIITKSQLPINQQIGFKSGSVLVNPLPSILSVPLHVYNVSRRTFNTLLVECFPVPGAEYRIDLIVDFEKFVYVNSSVPIDDPAFQSVDARNLLLPRGRRIRNLYRVSTKSNDRHYLSKLSVKHNLLEVYESRIPHTIEFIIDKGSKIVFSEDSRIRYRESIKEQLRTKPRDAPLQIRVHSRDLVAAENFDWNSESGAEDMSYLMYKEMRASDGVRVVKSLIVRHEGGVKRAIYAKVGKNTYRKYSFSKKRYAEISKKKFDGLISGDDVERVQVVFVCSEHPSIDASTWGSKPVIRLPFNKGEKQYFQRVNWEKSIVMLLKQEMETMSEYFSIIQTQSSDFHIPMGNLLSSNDMFMYSLDIVYSKELRRSGHVLWLSERSRPDIGGGLEDNENEEIFLTGLTNEFNRDDPLRLYPELEYKKPGFYHGDGISLFNVQLRYLPTVAIISRGDAARRAARNLTTKVRPRHIYHTLEPFWHVVDLVVNLIKRYKSNMMFLEPFLDRLELWLTDETSLTYDPSLGRLFHNSLTEYYNKFEAYLRKSSQDLSKDFELVLMNPTQVVFCVRGEHPEGREELEKFCRERMGIFRNVPGLQHLDWVETEVVAKYDRLLFIDNYNFAAKYKDKIVGILWDEFSLTSWTKEMIDGFTEVVEQLVLADNPSEFFVQRLTDLAIEVRNSGELDEKQMAEFFGSLWNVANTAGVPLVGPFKATLNSILGLDGNYAIQKLARDRHYVFSVDMNCRYCFHVNKINILDRHRKPGPIQCTACHFDMDMVLLETKLIILLQKLFIRFSLQQQVCKVCKKPGTRKMAQVCEKDAGEFKNQLSLKEFRAGLDAIRSRALDFKFYNLFEYVSSLVI